MIIRKAIEGRFDPNGFLWIKRVNGWTKCVCVNERHHCSDLCVGCGEPYIASVDGVYADTVTVPVCCGVWQFEKFSDNRKDK